MDTTKTSEGGTGVLNRGDETVRHAIANNLALLTKVGIRCIEIAQASSIQLKEEIRLRKVQKEEVNDSVDLSILTQKRTHSMYDQILSETRHMKKRVTISKRPTIMNNARA